MELNTFCFVIFSFFYKFLRIYYFSADIKNKKIKLIGQTLCTYFWFTVWIYICEAEQNLFCNFLDFL